jgi:AP-3 complex subunit delta
MLRPIEGINSFYQKVEANYSDTKPNVSKRLERRARNKDDPFYIVTDEVSSGASTPIHDILRRSNGEEVDIDAIPIMDLDLVGGTVMSNIETQTSHRKFPRIFDIAADENIDNSDSAADNFGTSVRRFTVNKGLSTSRGRKGKKTLLEVDSSGLGNFYMGGDKSVGDQSEVERQEADDSDMVKALAEVERLRLEMQRASERTFVSEEIPLEGTLVKKRKKKRDIGNQKKVTATAVSETLAVDKDTELDIQDTTGYVKTKRKKKNMVITSTKE